MNAKELTVTILGLAGTFLLPWPGEADRGIDPSPAPGILQYSGCARVCRPSAEREGQPQLRAEPGRPRHVAQWQAEP
jgi:hypothetical protein